MRLRGAMRYLGIGANGIIRLVAAGWFLVSFCFFGVLIWWGWQGSWMPGTLEMWHRNKRLKMDGKADDWKYTQNRISYLYEPYSSCYIINTL